MSKRLKLISGMAGCLLLMILLYIGGVVFYSSRYLPNTYINNIRCSSQSAEEMEHKLKLASDEYSLTIIRKDGSTEIIKGSDIDYKNTSGQDLEKIQKQQNQFRWPVELWGSSSYTIKTSASFNEQKLLEKISQLNCLTSLAIKEPKDAHIEITENGYEVIEEDDGNKLNRELAEKSIINAVSQAQDSIDLDKTSCYLKAKIKKDDPSIQKTINKIKRSTNMKIVFDFGKDKEIIDSSKISSWIVFDKKGNIKYDSERIKQYVKNIAAKYDTYGKRRTFKTHDGKTITLKKGILGWQINVDETVSQLKELIKNGKSKTVQPKYSLYCLSRKNNDIGDTYIEISLSKQHLWLYKKGKVDFESDVVTGLPNGKRNTPKGAYVVWSREKGATLGTYAVQGYATHVDYWMPFSWVGCGLHDAPWRGSFGGSIYKTNGSHGCVNCPPRTAKYLYENIRTGTPVIIY